MSSLRQHLIIEIEYVLTYIIFHLCYCLSILVEFKGQGQAGLIKRISDLPPNQNLICVEDLNKNTADIFSKLQLGQYLLE